MKTPLIIGITPFEKPDVKMWSVMIMHWRKTVSV